MFQIFDLFNSDGFWRKKEAGVFGELELFPRSKSNESKKVISVFSAEMPSIGWKTRPVVLSTKINALLSNDSFQKNIGARQCVLPKEKLVSAFSIQRNKKSLRVLSLKLHNFRVKNAIRWNAEKILFNNKFLI